MKLVVVMAAEGHQIGQALISESRVGLVVQFDVGDKADRTVLGRPEAR